MLLIFPTNSIFIFIYYFENGKYFLEIVMVKKKKSKKINTVGTSCKYSNKTNSMSKSIHA